MSPTYYYGSFGRVPQFYSSPLLLTNGQALQAAQTILARQLGTTQSVAFGAVVNPALEPSDTVLIQRPVAGIDQAHIIDRLTLPLTAEGAMSGQTRSREVL